MSSTAPSPSAGPAAAGPAGFVRTAWFHCYAGIAGDMALGSLLDAGADEGEVRAALGRLPLGGWSLTISRVLRGGLAATRAEVHVEEAEHGDGHGSGSGSGSGSGHAGRRLAEVLEVVEAGALPPRVLERSTAAFRLLAEVEGHLHGTPPDEVHFHELGAHDTIVDVVGTMTALELLGVDRVAASPVATGTGTVRSAHGTIPNPAPAVLGILRGAPLYGRDVAVELTTPTGAALLAATGATYGPLPPMTVSATGYGAGGRELDGLPNCTQVVVGAATDRPGGEPGGAGAGSGGVPAGQPLLLLEANVDDATGEELADAVAALLEAGALDAWTTPVVMKKGRPGHVVSALADLALAGQVRAAVLAQTGSFGVRSHLVDRYASERRFVEVDVLGARVRLKVAGRRVKVEHDDAAALARRLGVPVREVTRRALAAYDELRD